MPLNLTITCDADVKQLIAEARLVMGCNSTTLLEALLAGKTVACPDFGDAFDFDQWDLFDGYNHLMNYVSSYEELEKLIQTGKKYRDDEKNDLNSLFELYVYRADGKSSKRVEDAISKLLISSTC